MASETKYDYDVIVIGGGSGGLAAAKEAKRAKPEWKVAVFDYVQPSPHGTTWGLGGTCVNVGCIPKKLMHYASLMSHHFQNAKTLGWQINDSDKHNWETMVTAIDDYIRSLNYAFKMQLGGAGVTFFPYYAEFVDSHTIHYKDKKGADHIITSDKFILAVGGRPRYPSDTPGAKLAISSDDIFWSKKAPGKTLVVGASYIALETASFLHGLGYDVTVMVRSILLRGFDQQCANQLGEVLEREGIRFIRPAVPTKLERKQDNAPITVTWEHNGTKTEDFDTVIMAIGRDPCTKNIGIEKIGVRLDDNGYILVNEAEQTNISHIYAVGDVICSQANATKRPELTPVAIQAGQYLARRLAGISNKLMDYNLIPTAVFTGWEYGACGYSQEEAEAKFGKDNIDVYVSRYNELESQPTHVEAKEPRSHEFTEEKLWYRQLAKSQGQEWIDPAPGSYEYQNTYGPYEQNKMLAKLICDKSKGNRVIGFHFIGSNAGEVTQGFALAMRYGATKEGFDELVGIHPTAAEEFTVLDNTLASGRNFIKKEGCGGGGSCG